MTGQKEKHLKFKSTVFIDVAMEIIGQRWTWSMYMTQHLEITSVSFDYCLLLWENKLLFCVNCYWDSTQEKNKLTIDWNDARNWFHFKSNITSEQKKWWNNVDVIPRVL